jgi:mRNA-degrading endonuclease RelE of RelBE toxin-antitoxin system
MYNIKINQSVMAQLPKKDKKDFSQKMIEKLNTNLQNNFYRIKPIRNISDQSAYEMRIHLGKENFRFAFTIDHKNVNIFYLSTTLEKKEFDKEALKNETNPT